MLSTDNIILKNVSKKFGHHQVLDCVNLTITKGEITTIFGPSGSGKSTLLNIIGLVDTADEGSITIFGEKIPRVNSFMATQWRRKKLDYLFQNFGLIDDISVKKNLDISLKYKKMSNKEKKIKQLSALQEVGLDAKFITKKIYNLSGGEQQRVAIAKSILKDTDIILADEPTGSLDDENKKIIAHLLTKLKEKNKTVIIVSHDVHFKTISDNVYYMQK